MKENIAILIDNEIDRPKDYQPFTLSEIDEIKGEYLNIYIGDLIDYIPYDKIVETLQKICDNLAIGGKLHIKAPDIFQLCWYCAKLNLDLPKFKYIIYENGRRSCYTMDEIVSLLSTIQNLKIEHTSYSNAYEYSITAKKYETN
jgi:predicted SAM-dependent methyltransferase